MSLALSLRGNMSLKRPNGSYSFTNAEAQTYVEAMSVAPDNTRKALIDTLIGGLKTDGIWTKLDWLCLLAAHDSQAARLNAKNTAKSLTAVNSPTFTTDRGYSGDAVSQHLSFGELFTAAPNNYALNSATLGAWCNLGSGTTLVAHIGAEVATRALVQARNSVGNETFTINDSSTADVSQANPGTKTGHRTSVRQGAAVKRAFYNGARVADLTTASAATPAANGSVLRSVSTYSADRIACVYSGGALTDTEVGNMHSRLNTYLTAIGAN